MTVPGNDVVAYARASLPAPPARVLEVGAGRGELAHTLITLGYTVVAIDPDSNGPSVLPVALHEFKDEAASFDAAIAVVSLHHVEPLEASFRRLADLLRPGARLVVDEFDIGRFDERAAAWWIAQRRARGAETPHDPVTMVAEHRNHLHGLDAVCAALAPRFAFGEPVRGPYLYRWELDPSLRAAEEAAIARGELPATGARLVATRR